MEGRVESARSAGVCPGDSTLWPSLTGGEIIDLLGRLRGDVDPHRREDLLDRFDLDPTKRSRTYSRGDRQKVVLIAALASEVELLLLDEPTAGLDPLMEAVFRECVIEERDQGRTVLLSSHILSEVEALCDHVSIIRTGRTVETGVLAELRHLRRTTITAELAGKTLSTAGAASLSALEGVHHLRVEGDRVICEADPVALDEVMRRLTAIGLRGLVIQPPTLEELFLRHYADPAHLTDEWHRV